MAWIEAHQTLNNHPKLKRAARLAGIEQVAMIGYLMRLWWWCLDYAQDGNVTGYQPADLEDAVDWTGKPGVLHGAWMETGFLDVVTHENGEFDVLVHDWHQYAGRLLEKRAANAQRAHESRERARSVRATYAQRAGLPTKPTKPTEPTAPRPSGDPNPNGNGAAADFDQVEQAHGLYVGSRISKDQALAYERWLRITTPAAIIAALEAAQTNNAKAPHAYAMRILERQQTAGELPRNGPVIADFSAPAEVDASWM